MNTIDHPEISDWSALESAIPKADCADFMFIGCSGSIMLYKHRMCRRYLNIDAHSGKFYQYQQGRYVEIEDKRALDYVYQ